MKKFSLNARSSFYIAASLLLITACASSPPTYFYKLSAVNGETKTETMATKAAYRITVGQVTIPDAVNRTQIVTQHNANQVVLHENNRWAESLKTEIPRVVAQNIAAILPEARVAAYPQRLALEETDYSVVIDVQRFEATPGESILLDAQWSVRDEKNAQSAGQRTQIIEPVEGEDFDAVAAAFSRALGTVSENIAIEVQKYRQ